VLLYTSALAQEWTVQKLSGEVWIGMGRAQSVSLAVGDAVPVIASVSTGAKGRAVLVRGEQKMLLSPNSTIELADDASRTTILQSAGHILFDIDRREIPHFAVETPFMAAVVKGTEFTVAVHDGGADVEVRRGRVGVTDFATGQNVDVLPDQKASVARRGRAGIVLSGGGDLQRIRQGTPRSPAGDGLFNDTEGDPRPRPDAGRSAGTGMPGTIDFAVIDAYLRQLSRASLSDLDKEGWVIVACFGLFISHVGGRHIMKSYRRRRQRNAKR